METFKGFAHKSICFLKVLTLAVLARTLKPVHFQYDSIEPLVHQIFTTKKVSDHHAWTCVKAASCLPVQVPTSTFCLVRDCLHSFSFVVRFLSRLGWVGVCAFSCKVLACTKRVV